MADEHATVHESDLDGEESPLVRHAEFEMRRAGLFDQDADYGGTLAPHVMDLIRVFASGGHTGFSAPLTVELFARLAMFKTLTPITPAPEEWIDRSDISGEPTWQNARCPSVFSRDGGQTWYDLDGEHTREQEQPDA